MTGDAMDTDMWQMRASGERALAELQRKLATNELAGTVEALAARTQAGGVYAWSRNAASALRLVTELVADVARDVESRGLATSLGALTDDEVNKLTSVLAALHQKARAEAASRPAQAAGGAEKAEQGSAAA
jgi:hypothetical protein